MPKPEQAAYDAMDLAAELRCPIGTDISPLRKLYGELHALREVAQAAQRLADNFDAEPVGLKPIEQSLVDALKRLRTSSAKDE